MDEKLLHIWVREPGGSPEQRQAEAAASVRILKALHGFPDAQPTAEGLYGAYGLGKLG